MSAHLVAAEVSCGSASYGAHETTVSLGLHVRVCGAVLALLRLAVLLALRILVLWIGALLRELLSRCLAGIVALGLVRRLLAVSRNPLANVYKYGDAEKLDLPLLSLIIGRYLLAMLESAVGWGTILTLWLVKPLLLLVPLVLRIVVALVLRRC